MTQIQFGAFHPAALDVGPGDFARDAEELGFAGFWAGERPNNREATLDAFASLCFAAASTSRISVGSDVLITPLHHPAWIAKQFASLDELSGGRSILGLGVGGEWPKQFELFSVPVSERGRRTDEAIEVIEALWTGERVSHHGKHFQFEDVLMQPPPRQSPRPPIWIGGRPGGIEQTSTGELRYKSRSGAISRAARYGDVWCPYYMTPETYEASVVAIKRHADSIERDISGMGWALTTFWTVRGSHSEALEAAGGRARFGRDLSARVADYDILGDYTSIMRRLERYIAVGVEYFICNWSCGVTEVPGHLEWIASKILPQFG